MAAGDGTGEGAGPSDLTAAVRALIDKHRRTATGGPHDIVQRVLHDPDFPQSPDAIRQLEDVFGPFRRPGSRRVAFDADDVVQQSFPASDPPPPPER